MRVDILFGLHGCRRLGTIKLKANTQGGVDFLRALFEAFDPPRAKLSFEDCDEDLEIGEMTFEERIAYIYYLPKRDPRRWEADHISLRHEQ
jgi:hypothetical protein